MTSPIDIASAV